ncbi:MAG: DoxX family protein [Burkholderiaceae bacterium]
MNTQGLSALIGRVLLALMFLMAGFSKLGGLEGTAGYIASKGLPMPQLLAIGAAVLELVGAVLLIVGWQARWAALALAAFTLLATVLFHNFWAMPAEQQMMQQLMFLKNLAAIGGLLVVFAFGAGPLSLDARRRT